MSEPRIRETTRGAEIRLTLPNNRVFVAPRGTSLGEIFRAAFPSPQAPLVAGVVDETLRELAYPIDGDVCARPLFLTDSDGIRIYTRSLSFLMIVAAAQVFPGTRIYIDYSVPHGGYFCRVEGRAPFSMDELARVRERMATLVSEDQPIRRRRCSLEDIRSVFRERGAQDKLLLWEQQAEDRHLHMYELDGVSDYFFGYMVPSTGILEVFRLEPFSDGFLLRFPRREHPTKLSPPGRFTQLREIFNEYGRWLDVLQVRDVGSLNHAIRSGRIEQAILVSEALHEKRIAEIATEIAARKRVDGTRLVYIAGPSSSGKTTFSKRLAIQLLANGVQPMPVEMDAYFHPRGLLTERYGDAVDFDAFSALDSEQFRRDIERLVRGEAVDLPHYNFHTGERETGPTIRMGTDCVLLMEGIHGLNPALLPKDEDAGSYIRIFVSALTQLNLDSHNRVSTTDTRLLRRIVRDAAKRGYTAEGTLKLWENVRRGEKTNIFPFQEEADMMFNSALVYELSVLKTAAESLLLQVRDPKQRIEAERLLALLEWFDPCDSVSIPSNSILREFVGGSILEDFRPVPTGGEC